jgi:hypothetical protein
MGKAEWVEIKFSWWHLPGDGYYHRPDNKPSHGRLSAERLRFHRFGNATLGSWQATRGQGQDGSRSLCHE